jgi:hypothetical protein
MNKPAGDIAASTSWRWCGALTLLVTVALAGCGYDHKELFPQQYRTVAAPMFDNRSFYRGVEYDLAEALVKELELRTPYKVVSPPGADTILQGTITRVEQKLVARRRPGAMPQEMEVTVSVDFEWKDLRSGEIIRDRRGFEAVGRYVPTAPVGEAFEIAQHAAVENLAQDIVSTLQADW